MGGEDIEGVESLRHRPGQRGERGAQQLGGAVTLRLGRRRAQRRRP